MAEWNPDDFTLDGTYKFKSTFKPTTLICYRTDAVVKRSYKPTCAGQNEVKRGKVGAAPSRRSLNNLVFLLNNCDKPMRSMLTLTMADQVSQRNSVEFHNKTLKLALQRLRDLGNEQYCWIREFQNNGSVHWHIFTSLNAMSRPGAISKRKSKEWSDWLTRRYVKHGWCNPRCEYNMTHAAQDGFVGCCRFEQLRGNEAGRYAGKEGSKRFQKKARGKWKNAGCWWYASRNVKCTPICERKFNGDKLAQAKVTINGVEQEIAYRLQYNLGAGTL